MNEANTNINIKTQEPVSDVNCAIIEFFALMKHIWTVAWDSLKITVEASTIVHIYVLFEIHPENKKDTKHYIVYHKADV